MRVALERVTLFLILGLKIHKIVGFVLCFLRVSTKTIRLLYCLRSRCRAIVSSALPRWLFKEESVSVEELSADGCPAEICCF